MHQFATKYKSLKEYSVLNVFCLLALITIGFSSCNKDDAAPQIEQDVLDQEIIEKYLLDSGLTDVTTRHESGIFVQKIVETTNAPVATGNIVSIYFEANAMGQQLFDQISLAEGDVPVKMRHGVNAIFPIGLDAALGMLKLGEEAVFYLPSSMAYGELDELSSIIPANSVIRFKVSIAAIESDQDIFVRDTTSFRAMINTHYLDSLELFPIDTARYQPEGFFYKKRVYGTAGDFVVTGDTATINYKIFKLNQYPNGTPFDGRDGFAFPISVNKVVEGIDKSVAKMVRNERATFFLPSQLNLNIFIWRCPTPQIYFCILLQNHVIAYKCR